MHQQRTLIEETSDAPRRVSGEERHHERYLRKENRRLAVLLVLGLATVLATVLVSWACAQERGKIEVKDLSDLPVHTYKIEGSVSDLLGAGRPFFAFAKEVRANLETDLKNYDIKDTATLQRMYNTLLALDLLESRPDGGCRTSSASGTWKTRKRCG